MPNQTSSSTAKAQEVQPINFHNRKKECVFVPVKPQCTTADTTIAITDDINNIRVFI